LPGAAADVQDTVPWASRNVSAQTATVTNENVILPG
jgi:hypothetical protein